MSSHRKKHLRKDHKSFPRLGKELEVEIFKSLIHKSYLETAKEYKLHELSPESDDKRLASIVFALSRKIKRSPEIWGITPEVVQLVQEAQDNRSLKKNPKKAREIALMQEESFKDKLDDIRDTAAELIRKKLGKYTTNKGIDEVSLKDLKDLLATAIDKGRLLRGESTDNIIRLSHINVDDMRPEEALKLVFKAREALMESKK